MVQFDIGQGSVVQRGRVQLENGQEDTWLVQNA